MSQTVLSHLNEQGILTLTLNRPEVHNAFNEEMIQRLTDLFQEADQNNDIRLIILQANGESFCAGADLEWMKRAATYTKQDNINDAQNLDAMLSAIDRCKKPTIAVINGATYGGGVGLACVCDFVLGSEQAKFCLSEVKLGLIPAVIAPFVMRTIGTRATQHLGLSAEIIEGIEALHLGFLTHYSDREQVSETLSFLQKCLLKGSPEAQAHFKILINKLDQNPIDEHSARLTTQAIATARASKDGQEGIDAFLTKRTPQWMQS